MTTIVRRARQLLTLRGPAGARRGVAMRDLGLVENGAVLVRDGVVVAAGAADGVESLPEAPGALEIDAGGQVVMPGFVDSHTHLIYGAPRLADYQMRLEGASYAEIAAAGGGILSSVRTVRAASREQLAEQGTVSLATMARHGTTTVEAKSGYGLDRDTEFKTLELLTAWAGPGAHPEVVPTYLGAHFVPAGCSADEYIDWLCAEMLPEVARRRLARFADVYCDTGAFTAAQARRYLACARGCGLMLKIHAEQFEPSGGALVALELGAVSIDHLECAGPETVRAIAHSETVATLLPGSVFHLGLHRYAPARQLLEAGAAVALATDFNPGTSPTCNMQMILSLACTEMRMTPAEALCAATINGAHALRMAGRAGSIEPGKQADLLVMRVSDYREIPYYFGINHVRLTMKGGVIIE